MTKLKFLLSLQERLSDLPQGDVEERLNFYSEMIEDRMEEGLPEEDAVAAVGSIEEIASQIRNDLSLDKHEMPSPRSGATHKVWRTVLLVLGAPVWLSLLIALIAVVVSLYISLWAVVISMWCGVLGAVFETLLVILLSANLILADDISAGIMMLGLGMAGAGMVILLTIVCKAATKGMVLLTKWIAASIRKGFGKEGSVCANP